METYSISFDNIIKEYDLETLYCPVDPKELFINVSRVNRPGLQLAGFFDYYEKERIQIIGKVEYIYLAKLDPKERAERLETYFQTQPVSIIYTTSLPISEDVMKLAQKYAVPIFRTSSRTSVFMAALIEFLDWKLAPRITRHGGMVEVYGQGILLLGESGIGKSETAIELIKRGHRLVADDAVVIKRISAKNLIGEAPENIRHYMELRGIGIVDVCRLFGMGAIRESKHIDLIINLEKWQEGKTYDRFGLADDKMNFLGVDVPCITVPVSPGRNLSVVIEVAAMNLRLRQFGINTPEEFNAQLLKDMGL